LILFYEYHIFNRGDQPERGVAVNRDDLILISVDDHVGAAIFLRYSLTGFLRFWMARQSFEMNMLAERVFAGSLLTPSDGALARPTASPPTSSAR
jgi:hypothetical protein